MRDVYTLFSEYADSHKHPTNILIHKFCVPLIVLSLLGLLAYVPTRLPIALLVVVLVLVYYGFLAPRLCLHMLWIFALKLCFVWGVMRVFPEQALFLWISLFALAWIGQFIGHKFEGEKPSFFKDLLFLLVGPLWVLQSFLLKKT